MIGDRWGVTDAEMRRRYACDDFASDPHGSVIAVDPGCELTATVMGAHMSYAVLPHADGARLALKVNARTRPWLATALSLGDLVLARRQLLTLKALAEWDAAETPA